jgi:hypothetical protein
MVTEGLGREMVMPTRRTLLKAGVVLLPYVTPALISFRATPAKAASCSPGGGGGGGGGGSGFPSHDDNGHGNDPGKYDPSNPGASKDGTHGSAVDP